MTSEVIKLEYRAIINLIGGHKDKFNELVHQAMIINERQACQCGRKLISCTYGNKIDKNEAKVCTSCGTVYLDNKKIWRGMLQ